MRPALALMVLFAFGCDKDPATSGPPETAPPAATPLATAPEPPRAPDIVLDAANVTIGNDRVPTGDPALADRVAALVTGRPALASSIAGQTAGFVVMRNAKPSHVAAVLTALQRANATGAKVNTEARDGTTQTVPLSFTKGAAECATVAWIAKDDAIEVWPAGGGTAKRVSRGLAGPDVTLGTEAVRKQASGCNASELFVGADDGKTWGLVFDLATSALQAPGARASAAVLLTSAAPGRKLAGRVP